MKKPSTNLYLEINNSNFVFFVGRYDEQNNFKITHELSVAAQGINDNRISDLESAFNTIKENIYLIEQKFNYTFKEVILILDNFNPSFVNLSGFKKLNGSQVLKENITYIINTLKSCLDTNESNKTILHIFNSKFILDKKNIENLPIGLFGDFYSHELSFTLMNTNDYKNLNMIFDKCSLKIKKILIKSFIIGANISNNFKNIDTFFKIKLNSNSSKIFYFENNSLKFEYEFSFGTNTVIKDISKITSLKMETVKEILDKVEFNRNILEDEIIEKKLFNGEPFRKIKKKLIYEIALARIKEISEIILFKNINFLHYTTYAKNVFLDVGHELQRKSFKEIYKKSFSNENRYNLNFLNNLPATSMIGTANKLVHFGWKKEAIPVLKSKKSLIARFFDTIFG